MNNEILGWRSTNRNAWRRIYEQYVTSAWRLIRRLSIISQSRDTRFRNRRNLSDGRFIITRPTRSLFSAQCKHRAPRINSYDVVSRIWRQMTKFGALEK